MRDTLARWVGIHQTYLQTLSDHLRRHWQRDLTPEERDVVASFTLCESFMGLESMDRGLSLATTIETAHSHFNVMKARVAAHSSRVVAEIQRRLGPVSAAVRVESFSNLLEWEKALLAALPVQPVHPTSDWLKTSLSQDRK